MLKALHAEKIELEAKLKRMETSNKNLNQSMRNQKLREVLTPRIIKQFVLSQSGSGHINTPVATSLKLFGTTQYCYLITLCPSLLHQVIYCTIRVCNKRVINFLCLIISNFVGISQRVVTCAQRNFCWQNVSRFFCFVVGEPVVVILATQVFLYCNIYKFELN